MSREFHAYTRRRSQSRPTRTVTRAPTVVFRGSGLCPCSQWLRPGGGSSLPPADIKDQHPAHGSRHCRTRELYHINRARIKRDGSFVGRLTTEYTETPLATRIWLEKSRPRRKPAHFNTVYKRNEGWLRKAEGLISPTLFRARRAVSETSVVANPCKRSWSASGHWGAVSTSPPLPPPPLPTYK